MHREVFSMNKEFKTAGGMTLPKYESFERKWYKRCHEIVSRTLRLNSLNWQSNNKTSIPPIVTAVANFLLHNTEGSFLVGAFKTEPQVRFLFGNIDLEDIRADTYHNSEALDSDREESLLSAVSMEEDESEEEPEDEFVNSDDMGDDGPVNEFVNSDDFQGWNATLSKETLMRPGKAPIIDIPFDEGEMTSILENISKMNDLSDPDIDANDRGCQVDTLFWCTDIRDSGIQNKFIEITFLDGTFLKGQFETLLTICGITVDNRVLSLAHMLHGGAERKINSILFLKLVKKYVPLNWDGAHIISNQSKAFESAHETVFGEESYTCIVHLLRNVMTSTLGNGTTLFHGMVQKLDERTRNHARDALLDMFPETSRNPNHPTYNKISSKAELYCRSLRTDGFEQFTTNPVEQFHSTIKALKKGGAVNMI